ncbi:transcription-repair coupling factor [Candidatus Atribacteria bacterium RBG_19FT_COMBO_35_14]|uniref:Transcription-repair-coupling factor n=1 Tax=Candidatus Sediminicultor quintus TaxID=1797291 RepID=A0A1F5A6I3_9BACT|nr:MAG: transcription-repair coupling factor [Candidatus Atribacteria bacterium RBG_19FT_COMBO_35_14]
MSLPGILSLWNQSKEFKEIIKKIKGKLINKILLSGLKDSARSFFIAALVTKEEIKKSYLIITDSQENALKIYQDLDTFLNKSQNKEENVFLFPSFDALPYEDISSDPQIIQQRINILKHLSINDQNKKRVILIADIKALLPKLASPQKFKKVSWKLKVGDILKKEDFLKNLFDQNYHSVEIVEKKGQFSSRGGIIDFFPVTSENPLRLELFGDQIESIRYFNLSTQRSIIKLDDYTLLPSRELITDGSSNYNYCTIFDYLPEDLIVLQNEAELIKEKEEEFQEEAADIYQKMEQDKRELIFSPSSYFITNSEICGKLKSKNIINFTYLPEEKKGSISGNQEEKKEYTREFILEGQEISPYFGNLELFAKDLEKWQKEKQYIIILVRNEGRVQRLGEILEERGVERFTAGRLEEYTASPSTIFTSYGYLNYGFRFPNLRTILITDQEIFGKERNKRYKLTRHKSEPFSTAMDISSGDYIVHIDHGIGIYNGMVNLMVKGVKQDYLLIEYAQGDKLYVPVDQFNLVHKYIGIKDKTPKIYRLGGVSWGKVKGKAKRSIQKLAQELYNLYVARKEIRGFAFSRDNNWQQELEMSFPYEETYDQLQALSEVKADMEVVKPMERLVCGDVGYGKTEIAIRAAFKAVLDGKQVAILAPTTILVQQHYDNFRERMSPFPINIDMLSRFRTKQEQKKVIENLEEGKVDIIIGTHRLIQNDIRFKDLGLLIVDEEQRFGVLHKEKIKKLKESIDSLTLTATPIPRTLHMSLIGVRDLSVINTPPEDRFPIATYICRRDDRVIVEAIRRELDRDGQVFFVHNKVRSIQKIARDLNRLFPQARIGIAHGQMAEEQLEDIMIDFLEKKYDILVCTTIIEIGLDIPNVNTIIIDDAHKFGLSQLYQLRGRVGRSDRRAYAYFLYPSYRSISDTAKKRLQAIKEFSELGSGFKLAMRDLEIRGAGNLLGKEQHGSVGEVGFNLYCRLLEEAIKELREEKEEKEKEKEITPVIDVKIDAYIPGEYIPDLKQRVLIYKKLADINDLEGLERTKEELKDRYGIYPREVRNLLEIIYLKIFLRKLGIGSLVLKENKLILRYLENIELKAKLSRLPSFYQQRLIKEEYRLTGISKIDLSGIKSTEIMKFLKEFMINLAK